MQCGKLALSLKWVLLRGCEIPSEGVEQIRNMQIRNLFEIQQNINGKHTRCINPILE